MILWIVIALMTAAAILVVLWPLARGAGPSRTGSDLLVYQDQLEEIDRDRRAGTIGEAEAEAARIEVSRRLLAAADAKPTGDAPASPAQRLRHRRVAAVAALIVVPFVPLGFYFMLGSPDVPAQPAFARAQTPQGNQSIDGLISQVEMHLAQNPKDGAGWEVIAPVYMRLGRYDDAVQAWRHVLELNGVSAERESDFGEALVAAANGVVTVEAKQAFEAAVSSEPHQAKARYFIGMAQEQDGDSTAAASTWRAMLEEAPPGAPWVPFVRQALARLTGAPAAVPGPNASDVAAASNMSDDQRSQMIRGMVAKLADRLHSDGNDVEGWLRLVRSYAVLGDRDKAKEAAADAKRALASHPDEIKRIDDLTKDLGLEG